MVGWISDLSARLRSLPRPGRRLLALMFGLFGQRNFLKPRTSKPLQIRSFGLKHLMRTQPNRNSPFRRPPSYFSPLTKVPVSTHFLCSALDAA